MDRGVGDGFKHRGLDADGNLVACHVDASPRLQRLSHTRLDQAKADRIHIDVVPAPFLCQSLCQSDDACLAGGVAGLARIPILFLKWK